MKKLFFALIIISLITSCQRSRKGHWTKSDREKACEDCMDRQDLEPSFDLQNVEMNKYNKRERCEKWVNDLEVDYNNYKEAKEDWGRRDLEKR